MQLIQKLRDDQKCMKKFKPSSRSKVTKDIISIGSFVEVLVLNHYVLVKKILYLFIPFQVFSIWKAFGGNTRDLGSFGEEMDKITNQRQKSSRFKVLEPGDGVTIYTRRRHTSSSDGITTSLDGVSPHRLNSDLEDSTL
ncbi:hypothetical protein Tco_1195245 [Tanacetum coccineum]